MKSREYVGGNGTRRKYKKLIMTLCIIAAVFLAAVGIIGIIAGSGGAERERISAAVSENTELKQQISDLQNKVDELNSEVERLNEELEKRPTPTPVPTLPGRSPSPSPEAKTVPRANVR